jgi:hypothetical protein
MFLSTLPKGTFGISPHEKIEKNAMTNPHGYELD